MQTSEGKGAEKGGYRKYKRGSSKTPSNLYMYTNIRRKPKADLIQNHTPTSA